MSATRVRHGDPLQERQSNYGQAWLGSNNEYGIPALRLDMQAIAGDLPESWVKWGTVSRCRKAPHRAGLHFYTEDYKFSGLWAKPAQVGNARWQLAVEPNYSTGQGMPLAWVLYSLYKKRYLARTWQEQGVRVLVDLNVEPEFGRHALLGVPQGWRAYATRALENALKLVEYDHALACQHADTSDILFVVFGGHFKTKLLCKNNGWVHVPEHAEEVNNGKG